jgi:hypothetical protein
MLLRASVGMTLQIPCQQRKRCDFKELIETQLTRLLQFRSMP